MCESWGVGLDDLVFGYVGCLVLEKNFGVVLVVFEVVKVVQLCVWFVFVGDGLMWVELVVCVFDVVFVGQCSGDDFVEYYVGLDFFFFQFD